MTTPSIMSGSKASDLTAGDTLQTTLAERGLSHIELALRLGIPVARVSALIAGEEAISPETALQLAHILGHSAHFYQRRNQHERGSK